MEGDIPILRIPSERDTGDEPPRFQRAARLTLVLGLALLGAWILRAFLPALIWAAILAVATWPLYRRLSRRWPPGRHNLLFPSLFTAAVALCVLVPLAIAAIQIGLEGRNLYHIVEEARTHGLPAPDWLSRLPAGSAVAEWWRQNLADPSGYGEAVGRVNRGAFLGYTREFGTVVLRRGVIFGFTLVALFFLYRDGERVGTQLLAASHRAFGPSGERIGRQMVASIHGTVDGLVLVGLGEGFVIALSYWLAGVPHPAMLGAATGIAAMIPFAAPVVIAAAALLLVTTGAVLPAVLVFGFGLAVVFVADHFIRPALIGGATKLPFLWVLLGILGGVESFGLLGLFVGPAIMAALILIWREWTGPARATPPLVTERTASALPGS